MQKGIFILKNTIMIMIDGFGIPEAGWANSVYSEYCSERFIDLFAEFSIPLDATLGVPGIPQSATGQTAIFTGLNAAEFMQDHMQGFPGPKLRSLIAKQNIFGALKEKGFKVTFANAYVQHTLEELEKMRFMSVTSVMTKISSGVVKTLDDLLSGSAVYHDITRKTIAENYTVDTIPPELAAEHLVNLAAKNDFTLFEYFLTDRAGHKCDRNMLSEHLDEFSRFFCKLIDCAGEGIRIVLTSDHGNCEDMDRKRHTANPVPLFVYGSPLPDKEKINSIDKIYSYLMNCN